MVVGQRVFGIFVVFLAAVSFVHGCTQCTADMLTTDGYTMKTYTVSTANVINPERGGAVLKDSFDDVALGLTNNLTQAVLDDVLSTYGPVSIIWRRYYLDYLNTIPEDYEAVITGDFDVLRTGGFKAVIRFAYSNTQGVGTSEASSSQIKDHITQLTTILQANADVIFTVQVGFIGVNGNWYYSDQFGDERVINVQKWGERRAVVAALLGAVPTSRYLQISAPDFKQNVVESTVPLTLTDFRNASSNSTRIGHHNDCFLGNATDGITYTNVSTEYPYLEEETKYVPMGGTTCALNAPRSSCDKAKEELAKFHYTYLNLVQDADVIQSWKDDGCYDEILKKLGYRLYITEAYLPNNVTSGGDVCFQIKLKNLGYAAPINPRDFMVVLRNTAGTYLNYTSNHITEFDQVAPVLPESGEVTVSFSLKINVPAGDYDVLFELGDRLLPGRPEYNIILLNKGVPELDTALNNLNHLLKVEDGTGNGVCDGFTAKTVTLSTTGTRCSSECSGLRFTYPETARKTTEAAAAICFPSSIFTYMLALVPLFFLV